MIRLGIALAVVLFASTAAASDTQLSGREGHLRERFPLGVYLESTGEAGLDTIARSALQDWNGVAVSILGLRVFRETGTNEAQVFVTYDPAAQQKLMGLTQLRSDARGVIALPVRITVFPPEARGQTSRETNFYQIVAHELGHALGLEHTREPGSLMCCVHGSIDFGSPGQRQAYIDGRRHPDMRSVTKQLGDHYRKFWERNP